MMLKIYSTYVKRIETVLDSFDWQLVHQLSLNLQQAWESGDTVFLCGNGGSAGNAIHLANDFNYGIDRKRGIGLRVEALSANPSVITCLANDVGFENIYSQQLKVKADAGDILLVLSGSGNSPNVINALKIGNELEMQTFAILGFSGGQCLELAQHSIHFPINDMQISEDLQLMVGHICMQWLCQNNYEEEIL